MKIKRILIELELDKTDIPTHSTSIEFSNGMWTGDGPMYSRLGPALHEVWKTMRGECRKSGESGGE